MSRLTVAPPTSFKRRSRQLATALLVSADIFSLGRTASFKITLILTDSMVADFFVGVTSRW